MSFLRAVLTQVGSAPIHEAFTSCLLALEHDPAAEQPDMQTFVTQLATRDFRLLEHLATNPRLIAEEREAVVRVLREALRRTNSTRHREAVRRLAVRAGLGPRLTDTTAADSACLTASQASAFAQLAGLAQIYFDQAEAPEFPVALRLTPLVVGPSGVGKTHLAILLGRELGIPVMRFTVGDWLVLGSRQGQATFDLLQRALEQHDRLILYFDELDKYRVQDNAWSLSQMAEIFSVLDRAVDYGGTAAAPWTEAHNRKLRHRTFMIGSGTWQDLWSTEVGRRMGFGAVPPVRDEIAEKIRQARLIPTELLNRFLDQWIVLEPYTAEDFRVIGERLGIGRDILEPAEAAASGRNFRYIENALAAAALRRHLRRAEPDQPPAPRPAVAMPRSGQSRPDKIQSP